MTVARKPLSLVPVLAGGGTRLSAHIGALQALQELDIHIEHIVGVSGGSIVAALYATGQSLPAINQLALDVDFKQFRGYSPYQLFFRGGLSSGAHFEAWLTQQIGDVKFSDIPLGLHIVATDVQTGQPVIFNRSLTPDCRLVEAVRCSMGIPLLFAFKQREGKILVDGSILAEGILRRDWTGEGHPVCSFRIRSQGTASGSIVKPPALPRFIAMVIRSFMTSMSQEYIHDVYWNSTIVIDSGAISPLEFSLSQEKKQRLYQIGYQTTLEFLPKKLKRGICAVNDKPISDEQLAG